jgi:hypothetical protein
MDTAQVVGTIGLIVLVALVMVVAAFADRHRAQEIMHDRSRLAVPRPTPATPHRHRRSR